MEGDHNTSLESSKEDGHTSILMDKVMSRRGFQNVEDVKWQVSINLDTKCQL